MPHSLLQTRAKGRNQKGYAICRATYGMETSAHSPVASYALKRKMGENVLNDFAKELEDVAVVEKAPKLEGKNMFIILAKKAN